MHPAARLKWRKEAGRFAAYPLGTHHPEFVAAVSLNVGRHQSWTWRVSWPRWFEGTGYADDKQAAADAATECWWANVATEVPRDIESEVVLIAARVLVRPPPNSLYAEDAAFLTKLMDTLRLQYAEELRSDALPRQVRDLMTNLSQELFRRRTSAR